MDAVAIARPYAAAAFAYAQEKNAIENWQQAIANMAQAVAAVRQLVAEGALITETQAAEIAQSAAESGGGASDEQKRFISLLLENGRVFALPEIAERFNVLGMEHAGVIPVRVESAMPIKDKAGFDQHLAQRFDKKVQTTYEENSELLGGVRVYVNDDVIDASIRGRLDRLTRVLTTGKTQSL